MCVGEYSQHIYTKFYYAEHIDMFYLHIRICEGLPTSEQKKQTKKKHPPRTKWTQDTNRHVTEEAEGWK